MGDNGSISDGDSWDQANLAGYAQWAELEQLAADHRQRREQHDNDQHAGEEGNIVPMIAVGTGITPGSINARPYDHYSLLHTLEDYFGLGHLGNSVNAADLSFAYTPPTPPRPRRPRRARRQAAPTAPTISGRQPVRFALPGCPGGHGAFGPGAARNDVQVHALGSGERADRDHQVRRRRPPRARCVHPTRALRHAHARGCLRTLAVATLERASERVGPDRIPFSGRIGHHALAGAAYRATLTARNAAGPSKPVTLGFVVVGS